MNHHLIAFQDVINTAKQRPDFPIEAKLVLEGRIAYAVERGDISVKEAETLESLLGEDFRAKYRDIVQIAVFGNTDAELIASPT